VCACCGERNKEDTGEYIRVSVAALCGSALTSAATAATAAGRLRLGPGWERQLSQSFKDKNAIRGGEVCVGGYFGGCREKKRLCFCPSSSALGTVRRASAEAGSPPWPFIWRALETKIEIRGRPASAGRTRMRAPPLRYRGVAYPSVFSLGRLATPWSVLDASPPSRYPAGPTRQATRVRSHVPDAWGAPPRAAARGAPLAC
jgi:hypothetical protein